METVEELKNNLKIEKDATKFLDILAKLSSYRVNQDINDCKYYHNQALALPHIDLPSIYKLLAIKVRNYLLKDDREQINKSFNELTFFINENKNLKEEYAKWCALNIEILAFSGKYEEAINFGENVLKEIDDNVRNKWGIKNRIAHSYDRTGNVSRALVYYEETLELTSRYGLDLENADVLYSIAVLNAGNGNFKHAEKYFGIALKEYSELNEVVDIIYSFSSLASVYSELNEFEKAIKFYNKAIEKIHEHSFYGNYIHTLTNFGYFRLKQKNYTEYFKLESLILEYIKDKQIASNTAYFFYDTNAKAYLEYGNYEKAMYWIEKAENEEATKNDLHAQVSIMKLKVEIAKKSKNIDEVIQSYEKYIVLKEELINDGKQKAIEEFEAKYQNKQKEKEAEKHKSESLKFQLQSLRSQMNPHFVFNAISSISSHLNEGNIENSKYLLNSFARLMRSNLEFAESEKITLEEEIKFLTDYLHLEKNRLGKKLNFKINFPSDLEIDFIEIPSMLLQPYIENAIKHGVMPLEANGLITIDFKEQNDILYCTIIDNGIGRKAASLKQNKKEKHLGKSTTITETRLNLLSKKGKDIVKVEYADLKTEKGTKVVIKIHL
jgi:tetratricopeptide (TPR) repeat protein